MTLDGGVLSVDPLEKAAEPLIAWEETVFAAALDAARGRAWSRDAGLPAGGSSSSQARQLGSVERLTGLARSVDDREQERLAAALVVARLDLRENSAALARGVTLRHRGVAVARVLSKLADDRHAPDPLRRLLRAGHVAGLWGEPLIWEPRARVLRTVAFPSLGTHPVGHQVRPESVQVGRQRLWDGRARPPRNRRMERVRAPPASVSPAGRRTRAGPECPG